MALISEYQLAVQRLELIRNIAKLQGELLRKHRVGHSQWSAEVLVAGAFDGVIEPTNNSGFDVTTKSWGKVQVKSRVNGTDGKQNRANFGSYRLGQFDHAAIVIFDQNYTIAAATMLPCAATLSLVRRAGHVSWPSVRLHQEAMDIADLLRIIGGE